MAETEKSWTWTKQPVKNEIALILVGETNIQCRKDPESAFKYVARTLNAADVVFGHIEGLLSPPSDDPQENPDIPHKLLWRHSEPRMVEGYKAAGFDACSCASNVCYPPRAALDSIAILDKAGIAHCGAGINLEAARKPAILDVKGIRFGFLSYTSVFWHVNHAATEERPGCATIKIHTGYQPGRRALEMPGAEPTVITVADADSLDAMKSDVRNLKAQVDVAILSCHWGVSSKPEIVTYQQEVGRAAIDSGADIVFGHHPHVVQGVECYKGKKIFYSLGNFAFDWAKMRGRNLNGMMIQVLVGTDGIRDIALVPVRRNAHNLIEIVPPVSPEGRKIIEQLEERSAPFGTMIKKRARDVTCIEA